MPMSYIIQVLLFITHQFILLFSLWMVDANFIYILVFISYYFRSVWHPFGCFILRMVYLILNYFILFCVAFSLHIFIMFIPHCKYISIFKFLHPEFSHKSQCFKYTLTEPHAPKMLTPSTANACLGPNVEA